MLQSSQIRAARALLGWHQKDLAKVARIGLATIARIEQGEGVVQCNVSTLVRIQQALERKGIRFTDDPAGSFGVRLETSSHRR